jgi:sec-independent protein translocase protein TatB
MFDIGFGEMLLIGIVGLVVVGPERLPRYAAQAARFIRQFRQQIADARTTIVDAAEVDPAMLKDLRDLDPRRALNEPLPKTASAENRPSVILDPDTT